MRFFAFLFAFVFLHGIAASQQISESEKFRYIDIGKTLGRIEKVKRARLGSVVHIMDNDYKLTNAASKNEAVKALEELLDSQKKLATKPPVGLPRLDPATMRLGDSGTLLYPRCKVMNIVSQSEMLASNSDSVIWINGISTKNLVDNDAVLLDGTFEVSGKRNYTAVSGASRTVWEIKPCDMTLQIEEAKQLWIAANTRVWAVDGKQVKGRLIEVNNGTASILLETDDVVKARSNSLSGDDRNYIKEWEEPRKAAIREGYLSGLNN